MDFFDFNEKSERENATLAELFGTLLHHRKWFILSILVCGLIGFLYVRSTPKTFLRTAMVLVKDDKKGGQMGEAAAFQDLFHLGGSTVDNEIGIFKSKRLMYEVAKKLRLDVSYKVRSGLRKRELYAATPLVVEFPGMDAGQSLSLTATLLEDRHVELKDLKWANGRENEKRVVKPGDTVQTTLGKLVVTLPSTTSAAYAGIPVRVTKSSLKAVSDNYNLRLNVEAPNKQSSLINLSLKDENANRAEDVLNTLIEVYKDDAIEDKNRIVINTANFINERLAIIEADLAGVDAEIENYKRKNRLTDITSESALYLQSSSRLDTEGLNVENQLKMAEYMKEYLRDGAKQTEPIPASIGIAEAGIQNQIGEYNTTLAQRNKLMANSSANNPLVRELDTTLASMRLAISKAVDNLIAGLKIQTENMKNKERETRGKISFVPTQQKYVISVERQQKIKEELYLYLLNKKEENEPVGCHHFRNTAPQPGRTVEKRTV